MIATSPAPLDRMADGRLISDGADSTNSQAAQRSSYVALDIQKLALNQQANGQLHALFLCRQDFDVDRLEQANLHRLGDAAGITAI